MKGEVTVEIQKVENGYILKQTSGWVGIGETHIFKTLDEVVKRLKSVYGWE